MIDSLANDECDSSSHRMKIAMDDETLPTMINPDNSTGKHIPERLLSNEQNAVESYLTGS